MNQELFDEYDKFYDFTAENEAIAQKLEEKYKGLTGGQEFLYNLNDKANECEEVQEKDSNSNSEDEEEDSEWEDCDEEGEIVEKKPKKESAAKRQQKAYILRHARIMDDTDELLLPSGKIAGHRKYKTYYTQRPHIRTEEGNIRFLENGRKVYGGRTTYDSALMLKQKVNNGEI